MLWSVGQMGKVHCSSPKLYKHMYIMYVHVVTHTLVFWVLCFLLPGVSGLNFSLVLSRP